MSKVFSVRKEDIIGMVILSPIPLNRTWFSTIKELIYMYGIFIFLSQSLRFVSYKILDILISIIKTKRFYSVKSVAKRYRVPIYKPERINSNDFLQLLRSLKPDVIVSVNSPQIFKKTLITLPPLGCINVHGALLPKYRGMLPSFWVLANGEKETGVTVHYMDEKLDNGDIILQEKVTITPDDTQHTLILKNKKLGAELLLQALDQIEDRTVSTKPNNAEDATFFSLPTKADVEKFRRQGRKFR